MRYRCWREDDGGDGEANPMLVDADCHHEAAREFVRLREASNCEFPVAAGHESVIVVVEEDVSSMAGRWRVEVEGDPHPCYVSRDAPAKAS